MNFDKITFFSYILFWRFVSTLQDADALQRNAALCIQQVHMFERKLSQQSTLENEACCFDSRKRLVFVPFGCLSKLWNFEKVTRARRALKEVQERRREKEEKEKAEAEVRVFALSLSRRVCHSLTNPDFHMPSNTQVTRTLSTPQTTTTPKKGRG